ncbi:hypothetical protein ACQJBY_039142 [Aegilops geniculata]
MDGETRRPSPAAIARAASKVLGNDDLLIEILLRVGFPTTLVRAAVVCRRCYLHASDRRFLRRFRDRHPPRLLGFYAVVDKDWSVTTACFVPMLPQPPELAAIVRQVSSNFDAYQRAPKVSTYILGSRNDRILICQRDGSTGTGVTLGVHKMLCPEMGTTMFPPHPIPELQDGSSYTCEFLCKEEEGRMLSYWYLLMNSTTEGNNTMYVYFLRDGAWCIHNLAIDQIPHIPSQRQIVLVEDKIYMTAGQKHITVLDLTASSFSIIQLPQGVEHGMGSTMFSRADDANSVYIIHVKELEVRIWLHKEATWLLVDTICLHEMRASLDMSDNNALPRISQAGDNAEFVLLEMGGCVLYLDVKCRTLHRVYALAKEDGRLGYHPFMMLWPPSFPELKNDPATFAP